MTPTTTETCSIALGTDACDARIVALKKQLGRRLLILGHHYQAEEVIRHADITGDSFKLASQAAKNTEAEFIIFCGVHFMAESADILAQPHQHVILPDLGAGCSMADMANLDQVEVAYAHLGGAEKVLPVTYMNSSAAIKAFTGANGGAVCTSSNAPRLMQWALKQREKLIFLPDQHLGRNTALRFGIGLHEMAIWDPHALPEANLAAGCKTARVVLWKGHCSVHAKFLPSHIAEVRAKHPGIHVLVHPECSMEVVDLADSSGSTERIIEMVAAAPSGSAFAIGTEINLVARLAKRHPDKLVVSLSGTQCLCSTMYRIDPRALLASLEALAQGRVVNEIVVDEQTAQNARKALERMLSFA
ncbi:MAG: quinolinate synthase NadA [Planctomycetes bacterium]|nr:quinolinate synthase NadA [Planctomycetota bacterium]